MTFTAAGPCRPGLAGVLATLAGAPVAMAVAGALVLAEVPFAWCLAVRTTPR
ncbi:hypothetical protein [Amycolatopsis jejuensis]|uniref:hypothetical protein n=1 Tax=Amycolatopsis jejuensis TaxID=330084 RepID=UPI0012E0945B|nr:hypothetical protein [Amycolatopsis jejuensis]